MIAKEEILLLKTRLLPSGADAILDLLASKYDQLEMTQIALENVPLLIIGRLGMIARIISEGKLKKVSQPSEILQILQEFFTKSETLYLFINLPDLSVPAEVTQVLQEVSQLSYRKEEIQRQIDAALDARDKKAFDTAVRELSSIQHREHHSSWSQRRLI